MRIRKVNTGDGLDTEQISVVADDAQRRALGHRLTGDGLPDLALH